jgi:MFS family permease
MSVMIDTNEMICIKRSYPRSIGDYLDSAYHCDDGARSSSFLRRIFDEFHQRWRYYIIFVALAIANSSDASEIGCTNYALASSSFRRDILGVGNNNAIASSVSALVGAHLVGMVISGLLSGPLVDARGRRSIILIGLMLNSIVGILSSCVQNAKQLFALRFITGIGLGMVISGVVPLSAELSPPKFRGRYMALVSSGWVVGHLYTSLWALLIFGGENEEDEDESYGNWRFFLLVNAMPTMIAMLLVAAFVPESPRYYLCHGRLEEAANVANTIAGVLGKSDTDNINDVLTKEELCLYLQETKGDAVYVECQLERDEQAGILGELRAGLVSIKQVFMNGYWKSTVPVLLCYMLIQSSTGVSPWWTRLFQTLEPQNDAFTLSFYQTLAQIPGNMLATILIDTVGRQRLVFIGFGGGSLSLFLLSAMVHTDTGHHPVIVLALACSYTMSICVCWLSLDCISTESFPTRIRGTGRSICVATGRIAGFSIQFLYGPLVNRGYIGCMLGLSSLFAFGGMVMSSQTSDTLRYSLRDRWDSSSTTTEAATPSTLGDYSHESDPLLIKTTKDSRGLSI